MTIRAITVLTAIFLVGCSGQRGLPQVSAQSQTPTASADPTEPVAAPPPAPISNAEPLREEPAAQAYPRAFSVPAGTRVRVRLAQTLDTKYVRPGTTFAATLDEPIVEGNRVVVPRGTPFEGAVVASKTSGRFRGRAYLQLTLRSFRMNGRTYPVATAPDTRASGSHKKRNLALLGGGSAAGAGIGAIAGGGPGALIGAGAGAAAGATTEFITGRKNVRLPVETEMVFRLRAPLQLGRG